MCKQVFICCTLTSSQRDSLLADSLTFDTLPQVRSSDELLFLCLVIQKAFSLPHTLYSNNRVWQKLDSERCNSTQLNCAVNVALGSGVMAATCSDRHSSFTTLYNFWEKCCMSNYGHKNHWFAVHIQVLQTFQTTTNSVIVVIRSTSFPSLFAIANLLNTMSAILLQ